MVGGSLCIVGRNESADETWLYRVHLRVREATAVAFPHAELRRATVTADCGK